MSKREEIQVLERGMMPPKGVRFTATELTFEQVNASTLLEAGAWLQRVENCRAWWWGDYMVAYCKWKLRADGIREDDPDKAPRAYTHYTAEYAAAAGVEPPTLRMWRRLALAYEVTRRRAALSPQHHLEALDASHGNPQGADEWLTKAEANKWSCSTLRNMIRLAAIAASHEPMPPARMQELFAFNSWSRSQIKRVEQIEIEEAKWLRAELEPAAKLLAALDAKLSLVGAGGAPR